MASGIVPDFQDCDCADTVLAQLRRRALAMGFDAAAIVDMQDVPAFGPADLRRANGQGGAQPSARPSVQASVQASVQFDSASQAARRRIAPFLWPDLHLALDGSATYKLLSLAVPGLDLGCVGTIPIHGPGGCMACLHVAAGGTAADFQRLFHRRAHELQAMAIAAVQRLIELEVDGAIGTRLTDRQLDVLHWVVQGKTNWEIGQILGISPDTVRQHVMHIAGALKVRNRVQVAATAVARGMCTPAIGSVIPASELN